MNHRLAVLVFALLTGPFLLATSASSSGMAAPQLATSESLSGLAVPRPTASASPSAMAVPRAEAAASPWLGPPPRTGSQPRAGPSSRFRWPLAPPHPVTRPFDAPDSPYGPGHRGVDLGGTVGEPVLAAADGVVVFAGQLADRGVVSVDHPNGLRTTYEPVAPAVTAGRRVTAGAVLGRLRAGHAGCAGAPACLHWGVRREAEYLDPLTLVSTARIRLLPWKEDQ